MLKNSTSKYKTVADGGGYRFIFYCDVSDAHVCTTKEIYKGSEEEALLAACRQRVASISTFVTGAVDG